MDECLPSFHENMLESSPEYVAVEGDGSLYICKLCGMELSAPSYAFSYDAMGRGDVTTPKRTTSLMLSSPPNARFEWILDRAAGQPPSNKKEAEAAAAWVEKYKNKKFASLASILSFLKEGKEEGDFSVILPSSALFFHVPFLNAERKRIKAAGGWIAEKSPIFTHEEYTNIRHQYDLFLKKNSRGKGKKSINGTYVLYRILIKIGWDEPLARDRCANGFLKSKARMKALKEICDDVFGA